MSESTHIEGQAESVIDANDAEHRFLLFNATDGVGAFPEWLTFAEAQHLARTFHEQFRSQGYYKTSRGYRIPAREVVLLILDNKELTLPLAMQRLSHRWE